MRKILTLYSTFLALSKCDIENPGLVEPSKCEACKYFTIELKQRLTQTGKSKEVIRTGHGLSTKKEKTFKYNTSEIRLIESMENICNKMLEYNMHKERVGSLRFEKGKSETMKTLEGLKERGVKVDLGIPDEMWDEPSAEVTQMKRQCERMLEDSEEDIEEWYYHHQSEDIQDFICRQRILKSSDASCLDEVWTGKEVKNYDEETELEKDKQKLDEEIAREAKYEKTEL